MCDLLPAKQRKNAVEFQAIKKASGADTLAGSRQTVGLSTADFRGIIADSAPAV
jgi:hypothetical protein